MIKKLNALKNQKGMTLVELLAVMVIIGIIAAISIPAIGTLLENTRKDAHIANVQSLEDSARLYVTTNEADVANVFSASGTQTITLTYNSSGWTTADDNNAAAAHITDSFAAYVDNLVDPHTKGAYTEVEVKIEETATGTPKIYVSKLKGTKVGLNNTTKLKSSELKRSHIS